MFFRKKDAIFVTDSENQFIKCMNKRFIFHHWIWICSIAVFLILFCCGLWIYRIVWAPNFFSEKPVYVYIDEHKDWDQLCRELEDSAACLHIASFRQLASWMNYAGHLKTGRYRVDPKMSNLDLVRRLRSGHQEAVRLTFIGVRSREELARRMDEELMLSGDELLRMMNDSAWCDSMGFNKQTIVAMFIPNTYEVYWNVSPERFMARMKREYKAFWNDARRQKAQAAGLTPIEVSVLASIIEEESAAVDEYPVIAGLYLNRLKAGIPLQADPTVKFAVGDFSLRRVLDKHLEVDSPYNTYKYAGLPPGPIRIPSIQALDAVLNYTKHRYLYMCAKEDFSGRHNFAVTLAEHNRNAARYRSELNRRKIF